MGAFRKETFENIIDDYLDRGEESVLYKYLREGRLKEKCDKADATAQKRLIRKAAVDLMYNVGYSIASRAFDRRKADLEYGLRNDGLTEKELKEYQSRYEGKKYNAKKGKRTTKENGSIGRGNNTLLDLLDRWYDEVGPSNGGIYQGVSASQQPDLNACQSLFELLSRSRDFEEAAVPLKVDPLVGGGVYIVGKLLFGDKGDMFPYGDNYHCGLGILYPDIDYGLEMLLDPGENSGFPNVSEAFAFFEHDGSRMERLQGFNGKAPKGVPDIFKKYFQSDHGLGIDDELEAGIDEEIERNKQRFTKIEFGT